MVRQLVRRSLLLAPLPYHRTKGLTRREMLELAFDHLDLDGSGTLSVSGCRFRRFEPDQGDGGAAMIARWTGRGESIGTVPRLDVRALGDEEFGAPRRDAATTVDIDLTDCESKMTRSSATSTLTPAC